MTNETIERQHGKSESLSDADLLSYAISWAMGGGPQALKRLLDSLEAIDATSTWPAGRRAGQRLGQLLRSEPLVAQEFGHLLDLVTRGVEEGQVDPEALTLVEGITTALVDKNGQLVDRARAFDVDMSHGLVAFLSDQITRTVRGALANARARFAINNVSGHVEATIPLRYARQVGGTETRDALLVYSPSETWANDLDDVWLRQLLTEVHAFNASDLRLYALLMNQLARHGRDGFEFGPLALATAFGHGPRNPENCHPDELMRLHRQLCRLARLSLYVPDGRVRISGRHFKGVPFRGGAIFNVSPTAFVQSLTGRRVPAQWHVQPGPVGLFLTEEFGVHAPHAQFALFPAGIFRLNIYQREGAFRLALPLSQIWRIRAGKRGQLGRPWRLRALITDAGITLPSERSHQWGWVERRDNDLEALVDVGLLWSWHWTPPEIADMIIARRRPRGWFDRLLRDGRLILEPHPDILRAYADAGLKGAADYVE